MNKQEKKRIVVTAMLMAILVGAVAYAAMGQAYNRGFSDGLGVNREEPALYGHLSIFVMRGDSQVWSLVWSHENLITDAGRLDICDYIGGTAGNAFDWIQVGTGTGGNAASTALATPFSTRQQGTFAEPVAYNWTITYTFGASFFDGEVITEAAVFNAVTGDTMLNYQEFSGITLSAADSLQVQFEFMITDAG